MHDRERLGAADYRGGRRITRCASTAPRGDAGVSSHARQAAK